MFSIRVNVLRKLGSVFCGELQPSSFAVFTLCDPGPSTITGYTTTV